MANRVVLILDEGARGSRRVLVNSQRFTIGRAADNDLVVNAPRVADRHATVSAFLGVTCVNDCGSRAGTTLNGQRLMKPGQLRDGDVIGLAGACDIRVKVVPAPLAPLYAMAGNKAMAAAFAALLAAIVLAALALVIVNASRSSEKDASGVEARESALGAKPADEEGAARTATRARADEEEGSSQSTSAEESGASEGPGATTDERKASASTEGREEDASTGGRKASASTKERQAGDGQDSGGGESQGGRVGRGDSSEIESAAAKVVRRISHDGRPYAFGEGPVNDIAARVEAYSQSPSMAGALRQMQAGMDPVVRLARREGIEPSLVVFAALAATDGGHTGRDPSDEARALLPELVELSKTFGGNGADSNLIILAAQTEGAGTKRSHPLLTRIHATRDPVGERNVWYLHDNGIINARAYDFVISFLACGIIAQDPRRFGVDADALAL